VDRVAAVGIGSNLGDRLAHIDFARARLSTLLSSPRFSATIETAPVGVPDTQPPYLNLVVVGTTSWPAGDLLAALLAIERERGRERLFPNAARTLDLDLLLLGELVIDQAGLVVPHPRFRERLFVLEPLVEVAPRLQDPVTHQTMSQLLAALRQSAPARSGRHR
jgi:2-amino-4-hydroxy-6-hydroxymethyldihydropteridine diphosphokinase